MKAGDLVKDNHPYRGMGPERIGVVISESTVEISTSLNRAFKVLWRNGTIGNNIWDYDLKVVNESR